MTFFDQILFNQAMLVLYLIVAVAAVIGVFLTYFYRPIKIEIVKQHSDDLKGIVRQWKEEVPEVLSALHAEKSEPTPLELPVEKEHLFSDLEHHMPPDLNLLDVWKTFKSEYDEYARKRYRLFKDICGGVVNRTGLGIGQKKDEVAEFYIESIYWDAFNIADNRLRQYDNMNYEITTDNAGFLLRGKRHPASGMAYVSNKEVADKLKRIHKKMMSELADSDYVGKAKSLLDDQKALEERRENLLITLNGFISIPIFPRNCRYISWSIYGIFMSIKERFYWLKRRF